MTTIGNTAFSECTSLTSIQVKDGNPVYDSRGNCNAIILTENNKLIIGCKNTKIPNSVTSIGSYAFYGCSGLTSITIPNNVTSIGYFAFECENLATVVSLIKNPVAIDFFAFSNNAFLSATLYVPVGTISKYKSTEGWKRFVFIEEGTDGGDTPDTPEPEKCEKPTINYYKGKLSFNCATDGATCQYSITDTDIKTGSGSELQLGVTYQISVYATKQGCYNSEVATATLCWIDVDPKTEGIENGVANVKAMPVLIQSEGGLLHITGAPEGVNISIYNTGGQMVGFAKASSDTTVIPTTLSQGSIAIVKIGEKAVKVLMK